MAAKKAPKHTPLTKGAVTSSVKLSVGDAITDEAEVSVHIDLDSTLEGARPSSTGMMMRIHLPDGTVMAGKDGAIAMARAEAAAILRRMASRVARG